MLYVRLLFWLLVNLFLLNLLHSGFHLGGEDIPALGRFLNPEKGVWKNAENAVKHKDRKIKIDGINASIEIYFDQRMVPHIYADNIEDALFAQGYVEAYFRLWQMDFIARAAGGRLSEVVGKKALRRDIRQRKSGMMLAAENALESWAKHNNIRMNKYVSGINAYIDKLKSSDYPIEFKLLGYQPEEWTALHSALVLKSMTSTLASYNEDIAATNTFNQLGEEKFNLLFPNIDPNQSPVIPSDIKYAEVENPVRAKPDGQLFADGFFEDLTVFKGMKGVGSNNWAVHPDNSESGNTLLSNDPHLNLTLPSIWIEMHIVTPEFNAYGVSIPGMPGIMIGFNEHIAWGNTNVGHDFTDYYTIEWLDEEKTQYKLDGQVESVEFRRETIKIKDTEDYTFDVKMSHFGPVYAESESSNSQDLARDWIGYKIHDLNETSVFVDIMKAENYQEFKSASNQFFAPAQNFLFADRQNIALRVNGNLPLKYHNEGRFVKTGHSKLNQNSEYIDRAMNPEVLNPARGFASSANQVSTGTDYPYYYHGSFEEYRGKRVNQLLSQKETHTVDDMKAMQRDVYSLKAEQFLPLMIDNIPQDSLTEDAAEIVSFLMNWDKNYHGQSTESKYFHSWFRSFRSAVWQPLFDSTSEMSVIYPEDFILYDLISNPEGEVGQLLGYSLKQLAIDLTTGFQDMMDKFDGNHIDQVWGQYRPKSIHHMLQIPAFSYNDLELGGCGDVLNAISSGIGPSWRMVVEMDESTKAWVILPGGQSGDPSSPFYDDSMEKWINGEYHEIDLSLNRETIKSQKLCSLTLQTK